MTVTGTKTTTLSLAILLFAFSTGLLGAPVDSRITAVTVYGDRAIVTRTASSDLPAGEHTLAFENLPTALVDQSLQASGRGIAGATILDVSVQNIFVEANANERVRAVEDQLKSLQKQRRVLDDRVKILEEQRGFVQRMLAAATGPVAVAIPGAAPARPGLDEWQKLFEYAEQSLGKIAAELQSIDTQREDLQAKSRYSIGSSQNCAEPGGASPRQLRCASRLRRLDGLMSRFAMRSPMPDGARPMTRVCAVQIEQSSSPISVLFGTALVKIGTMSR